MRDPLKMCYSALIEKDLKKLSKEFGHSVLQDYFGWFEKESSEDPKKFPPITSRIFPKSFAPILSSTKEDGIGIIPARYSTFLNFSDASNKYTSFNARRDNLESKFWSNAFLVEHGAISIRSFFEWVDVKDLVKAKKISILEITNHFEHLLEARQKKCELENKEFKLTPTEKKKPIDRKIMIQFESPENNNLWIPIIISRDQTVKNSIQTPGFAMITDDPPNEVKAAGHDRCPIFLNEKSLDDWLEVSNLDASSSKLQRAYKILDEGRKQFFFDHKLAKAA